VGKSEQKRAALLPGGYPPGAEPFLAAIIADREDDTPRLVFADWLQEQGEDDRAEFIRVQIELQNRLPWWDDALNRDTYETLANRIAKFPQDALALYERQRTLLARHRTQWLTGYPRWAFAPLWQSFRRGFPRAVQTKPENWLRDGAALRGWFPLEEVAFDGERGDYASVFAAPSLVGIPLLTLRYAGNSVLRALAAAPALGSVGGLRLDVAYSSNTEPDSLRAALGSPFLARVRELSSEIGGAAPLPDTFARAVAHSPHLRNLERLRLNFLMSADVCAELLRSPNVANLTELTLNCTHTDGDTDLALVSRLTGNGVIRALVGPAGPSRLTRLKLGCSDATDEGWDLLGRWPGLGSVTDLDLWRTRIGLDGMTTLSESPYIGQLRTLVFPKHPDPATNEAIAALPGFAHVRLTNAR
jgi:uncharacterized protein (TIGR02996 family)